MQQRVPIKHFNTFAEAHEAKEKLQIANPNNTYSVRRYHSGFNVVRRFPVNSIKQYEEAYQHKRRGPSKKEKREAFLSGLR